MKVGTLTLANSNRSAPLLKYVRIAEKFSTGNERLEHLISKNTFLFDLKPSNKSSKILRSYFDNDEYFLELTKLIKGNNYLSTILNPLVSDEEKIAYIEMYLKKSFAEEISEDSESIKLVKKEDKNIEAKVGCNIVFSGQKLIEANCKSGVITRYYKRTLGFSYQNLVQSFTSMWVIKTPRKIKLRVFEIIECSKSPSLSLVSDLTELGIKAFSDDDSWDLFYCSPAEWVLGSFDLKENVYIFKAIM